MENSAVGVPKKILFMDDDETVRRVSGKMLGRLGFEVVFAKDGDQATQLYRQALNSGVGFDAVILALAVSNRRGGLEAIETLVEMDPSVKAIAMSSYIFDPLIENYTEYGFRGVLRKPYTLSELTKVTHEVVS